MLTFLKYMHEEIRAIRRKTLSFCPVQQKRLLIPEFATFSFQTHRVLLPFPLELIHSNFFGGMLATYVARLTRCLKRYLLVQQKGANSIQWKSGVKTVSFFVMSFSSSGPKEFQKCISFSSPSLPWRNCCH